MSIVTLWRWQPNLRPTVVYPCSVCKADVLDDDKAVCCDSCDQWQGGVTPVVYVLQSVAAVKVGQE